MGRFETRREEIRSREPREGFLETLEAPPLDHFRTQVTRKSFPNFDHQLGEACKSFASEQLERTYSFLLLAKHYRSIPLE